MYMDTYMYMGEEGGYIHNYTNSFTISLNVFKSTLHVYDYTCTCIHVHVYTRVEKFA